MGSQWHSAEQTFDKLREAEVLQGKGMPMAENARQLGISDATYYRWRENGGLRVAGTLCRRHLDPPITRISEGSQARDRRSCGQFPRTRRQKREPFRQRIVVKGNGFPYTGLSAAPLRRIPPAHSGLR